MAINSISFYFDCINNVSITYKIVKWCKQGIDKASPTKILSFGRKAVQFDVSFILLFKYFYILMNCFVHEG